MNSLLQALASLTDERWWALLDGEPRYGAADLLASLAAALRWINRRPPRTGGEDDGGEHPSRAVMRALELALLEECRLSPSAEQDVHEALVQVLEAIDGGLLRRQVHAARGPRPRCTLAPLRPLQPLTLAAWPEAVALAAASAGLSELWGGLLEEFRICCTCMLPRTDRSEDRQAFRCLSLSVPGESGGSLASVLRADFGGGKTEHVDGVACPRCSLLASLARCRYEAARGSLPALSACRLLRGPAEAAQGVLPAEALLPLGAPRLVEARSRMLRTHSVVRAPRVLALHLRRLAYGPYGMTKSEVPVGYPMILDLAPLCSSQSASAAAADRQGPAVLKLRSVVSHFGSAHGGHYVVHRRWLSPGRPRHLASWLRLAAAAPPGPPLSAALRGRWLVDRQGGPWVLADDDRVSLVDPQQALMQRGAYLFLYEAVPCDPGCFAAPTAA